MSDVTQVLQHVGYGYSQAAEGDLRGWEWHYLWRLTRSSALVTLTNRPTPGFSVSFSADGLGIRTA